MRQRLILFVALVACCAVAHPCYYGEYGFDPEKKQQTTPFDLINEKYAEEQQRNSSYYRTVLKGVEEEKEKKDNDPEWLDSYAFLLMRAGSNKEAFAIWSGLLKQDPKRFSTLCNLGTAMHAVSRFDEAARYLQAAVALRPEFRGGAEKYHLQMVQFLGQQRKQSDYAKNHLFVEDLTPVWMNRKLPPETFAKDKSFPKHSAEGVAELLRQYPRFGDGWLVLGMLLENQGDHYLALRAYQRASKFGTGQRDELKSYLRAYSDFAVAHDPPRSAARKLKYTLVILVAVGVLYGLLRVARVVVLDLTSRDKKAAPLDPKKK